MSSFSILPIIQPEEAALLHEASLRAIEIVGATGPCDEVARDRIANIVLAIACSARFNEGTIDVMGLTQAAVERFESASYPDLAKATELMSLHG